MSIDADVEQQLRDAFTGVPSTGQLPPEVLIRTITIGRSRRRRRVVAAVGGGAGAVAAVVAAAVIGASMGTAAAPSQRLAPAGGAATSATPSGTPTLSGTPTPSGTPTRPAKKMSSGSSIPGSVILHDNNGAEIDGVGGFLLPHGSQLPSGETYGGTGGTYGRGPRTSMFDALTGASFLSTNIGSSHNLPIGDANAPDTFGMVATAWDLAANSAADGDPAQRVVDSNITRFRTAQDAAGAIAKAKTRNGPWVWVQEPDRSLAWDGVSGQTGEHHLWHFAGPGPGPGSCYEAVQVVGPFIVSASSENPAHATNAVAAMVGNMQRAGLL